jgi:hypothetical protein
MVITRRVDSCGYTKGAVTVDATSGGAALKYAWTA